MNIVFGAYSLYYYDFVRWSFLFLMFSSILSAGWFGIPLAPEYFTDDDVQTLNLFFTISSILGVVWGLMAYRELTRSKNKIINARDLCKKLDPVIGNYDYKSFNPISKKYHHGYTPLGPVHFWDPESMVPSWLDRGKYWYIFSNLQSSKKNILLRVFSDEKIGFFSQKQYVAITSKELISRYGRLRKRNYRYVVSIPQWLVMDTDYGKFSTLKHQLNVRDDASLVNLINSINRQLIEATNEIIEQESQRLKYPWKIGTFLIYLNKSLPIRIIYNEILKEFKKHIPKQQKNIINNTNLNLGYIPDKKLMDSLLLLVSTKGIAKDNIDKIDSLLRFLHNAYNKQGLGEGSNKYHNFHHSLEVAFVVLQLLPKKIHQYEFSDKDIEILTVASLLHDYDPSQRYDNKLSIGLGKAEGPKVERTLDEISKNKIHEAYFLLNSSEFRNYFDDYYSYSLPPLKYNTTHPEYLIKNNTNKGKNKNNKSNKPIESFIIECLILRTDYPFNLKENSQKKIQKNFKILGFRKSRF